MHIEDFHYAFQGFLKELSTKAGKPLTRMERELDDKWMFSFYIPKELLNDTRGKAVRTDGGEFAED